MILSLMVSLVALSAHAATPPAGNYKNSCSNIVWNDGPVYFTLTANCTNSRGAPRSTSIYNATYAMLNGQVENRNGNLSASGITPGGPWTNTCVASTYNYQSHLLVASCAMNNSNTMITTSLTVYPSQSVVNNNGYLQFG